MSGSFTLTLDTVTHVGAALNGGAETAPSSRVLLGLALDADAVEMKIWGALNFDSEFSAGMGHDEEDAAWLPAAAAVELALAEGQGQRTVSVKVRDDVWNEATATATIFVGEDRPLPVEPPRPSHGRPTPRRPRPKLRTVRDRSKLRLPASNHARVLVAGSSRVSTSSHGLVTGAIAARSRVRTSTSVNTVVRSSHTSNVRLTFVGRVHKSSGGEMEAIVAALL